MFKEWLLLAVYLFDVGYPNEVHRIDWTRSGVSQFGPNNPLMVSLGDKLILNCVVDDFPTIWRLNELEQFENCSCDIPVENPCTTDQLISRFCLPMFQFYNFTILINENDGALSSVLDYRQGRTYYLTTFPVNNQVSARSGGDCLPSETETGLRMSLTVQYRATGSETLCSIRLRPRSTATKLSGNAVICPGNSGLFECKTTNTRLLSWRVNDISLFIPGDHQVNDSSIIVSGNIATLVELDLTNGNVGDRIAILRVPPRTNGLPPRTNGLPPRTNGLPPRTRITCTGGYSMATCMKDVLFIGRRDIERLIYRNHTRSEDGETTTYFWEHKLEVAVSYYILTLVAAKDGGQVLQYNVTSTSITIPSTSIDMNGSLSAVSVCGDVSEPASFQVAGTTGLKSLSIVLLLCFVILSS